MTSHSNYLAWEQTSRTTVHIIQIDRGDGTASQRLTLTDKPYYDKGVSGTKYHDTYPAPIQAIVSDIETNEKEKTTTFSDLVLANGDGKFDDIQTAYPIIGQRVTVLRGDQNFSLMEEDFPNRFIEIFRGRVNQVLPDRGGALVKIRIGVFEFDLDHRVGFEGFPRAFGQCFNIPFQLIDSANHDYKCTSYNTDDSKANFTVRDEGVELTHPDDPGPDYSIVLESGKFFGKIRLNSAPTGKLTADINTDYGNECLRSVRTAIDVSARDGLPGFDEVLDHAADGDIFYMMPGELTYFIADSSGGLVEDYALSPAGDLSTSTASGNSYNLLTDLDTVEGVCVNSGETRLYAVGSLAGADVIALFDYGTSGDISTLSLQDTFDIDAAGLLGTPVNIRVNSDEDRVWVSTLFDNIYQLDVGTVGDISTTAYNSVLQELDKFDRRARAFDIADDEKRLYIAGTSNGTIFQFRLVDAGDISNIYFERRAIRHTSTSSNIDPYALHAGETSLFTFDYGDELNRIEYHDGNYLLPYNPLIHNIWGNQGEMAAGAFYDTLTPIRTVIDELLKSINADRSTDRFGQIRAIQLRDPELALSLEAIYEIGYGDFISTKEYIEPVSARLPAENVYITVKRNFSPQNDADLAGAVSEDDRALYGRQESQYKATNSLDSWQQSEDIFIDGYASESDSDSQEVADELAALADVARYTYRLSLNLRCISQLSDFDLGSIIAVSGDWKHPDFSDGDQLFVTGRRINWSKNKQSITVFK